VLRTSVSTLELGLQSRHALLKLVQPFSERGMYRPVAASGAPQQSLVNFL
jgi:hypothetical protein